VKIEIDGVYRKPSNLFHLNVVLFGKVYRIPHGFIGTYDENLEIYDHTTGQKLVCAKIRANLQEITPSSSIIKSYIIKYFTLELKRNNYSMNRVGGKFESSYYAHSPSKAIHTEDQDIYKIFDGFEYRILCIEDTFFLCLNPHLKIEMVASVKELMGKGLPPDVVVSLKATYRDNQGNSHRCILVSLKGDTCALRNMDYGRDEEINVADIHIIPRPEILQYILNKLQRSSNIIQTQRQYSFLAQKEAAKARFNKTMEIATDVASKIFPLCFGDFKIEFVPKTISLRL